MSTHGAKVTWRREGAAFTDNRYSRKHVWSFDGGATVAASASPSVVPPPLSDPSAVDPEEAYIASLSSCHMLWFLALAAEAGFAVESYEDDALGFMVASTEDDMHIELVELHPVVDYAGKRPTRGEEEALHHKAHERCFIANSVRTRIETILPVP